MKKLYGLIALMMILPVIAPAFAQTSVLYCTSNSTLVKNVTLTTTVNNATTNTTVVTSVSETQKCPFGCDNSTGGTNDCKPDPTQPTLFILVPPIVLFLLTFLFIYIAINMKQWQELQFMFLGVALLMMIIAAWFAQSQAVATLNTNAASVLVVVYYAMILVFTFVVAYFILSILYKSFKMAKEKRNSYS